MCGWSEGTRRLQQHRRATAGFMRALRTGPRPRNMPRVGALRGEVGVLHGGLVRTSRQHHEMCIALTRP
eukprot:11997630-Alexandrium_andersonii.AAC.1